jgi:hypothetical protein
MQSKPVAELGKDFGVGFKGDEVLSVCFQIHCSNHAGQVVVSLQMCLLADV